ncbi:MULTISPECIES: DUF3301 domain-containing protein [unclassified Hahella]|uniref:DUF3301 domain-containing protein n=1 Tax=unclassified Hahella TaxID=2624107 RepID=UPI001C1ED121|nr:MULTISPECIES: DUF3301 domain-containing protein [unclassified Hahella]MBU6952094.1 DUF3301 domain-containing protein [Hahella sp. HN01]MDG9670096.1 DUF3301 domain-containing protein [Hahella sp. CR1]
MNLQLIDLFWLTLCAIALWGWWEALKVREIALGAARRQCQELDLQFLDGSVALRKLGLRRDARGSMRLARTYTFEFSSTGEERYNGEVDTLGRWVKDVRLDAHRISYH